MPSNAVSKAPRQQASSTEVARLWLFKFAEMCQRPATRALALIWDEQLQDIPPDLLDRACDRLAKTHRGNFLPTPADVRSVVEDTNTKGLKYRSEKAWEQALDYAVRYCGDPDAPGLSAVIVHAIRAAGGLRWIERCPESELQWARNRFLDAYVNFEQLHQDELLLTDGAARALLGELTDRAAKVLTR